MKLTALEDKINIKFDNQKLLRNAFIHRSYLNEHRKEKLASNEKLEFLGDSVLSLITSLYLFKKYPLFNEGVYTDIKAAIVRTESLYKAASQLKLGDYLFLSKGEEENKGRENVSILADCFEALLGSIFLEKGFNHSYRFVEKFLFNSRLQSIIDNKQYQPAKNIIQELYQDRYKRPPIYKVLEENGPQHNKVYTVGVYRDSHRLAIGKGKSKKEAEEDAARKALSSSNL